MKKILDNLANLVKVKTLVTLAVISVFIVLALRGQIEPDKVNLVVTSVIAFYFGTVSERAGEGR